MTATTRTARAWRRGATVLAAGALAATGLTACSSSSSGSGSSSGSTASASDIAAALQKKSTITVWAWAPQTKDIVSAFEKKYPNVTVNLVNAGTSTTEYTKLQNAIKAGSGIPDVSQIEYYALPQFALAGSVQSLDGYGLDSLKSDYSTAVWDAVTVNGQLDALPQDTGPMALFYNKKIFDKYGLSVPTTWDQYVADAQKLHSANPNEYITSDSGDPGFVTSMVWQAGGKPYTVSGTTNVTINSQDPGTAKWAAEWDKLEEKGLLSQINGWTSQWFTALGNGTIASLVTGAWMPGNLETSAAAGSGDWRVAPMPTYDGTTAASAENGGSSYAVMKGSSNALAAAGFIQFMNAGDGETIFANEGGFPSLNSVLNSSSFLDQAPSYFGGQKINTVLSAAAASVLPGWSYLPFQVYANSIFPDSVGKAYEAKTDIAPAINTWFKASGTYGSQQGFTVTTK
ncbi:sugar ABC transporter substrate-binding protein [Actinospica sp.]|jgi:multiple sugar transport system substrate-binding protein|uniref:ABC transporter substrate-binding protein n=1 Tax=Actinospica sp. TaxID=1872142 RepID=UPI002C880DCA|nr:sugar ABC transporter substrate-binding protein [Actinospica sp.]HWG25111.1 sugar ABC transporter substrate-binding protein [Actinospica sp.]